MFETFDHTADLGLRMRAATKAALFEEAGLGLTSILVGRPDLLRGEEERRVEVTAPDEEYLFFDWLNELLFLFEFEGWIASGFQVESDELSVTAVLSGQTFDPQRHGYSHEVKAITYHGLKIERNSDGWLAEVIVDI